jgi:hypothetical protein
MTVDEVNQRVRDIEASRRDDEAAHSMEDDLWRDVLTAIACGMCDNPAACANAAIRTQEIEFARWCA